MSLRVSKYDNRKLLVAFFIVITALIIDESIGNFADILSNQTVTFWGVSLFIIMAAIYVAGGYLILGMIRAKIKESKTNPANVSLVDKTVTTAQYILTAILILIVVQILVISHYFTNLLIASTAISYGLTSFLMALLTYRLFSWFRRHRSLVVLLYGLAAATITLNAIDSIIINIVPLLSKPTMISPQSQVIFQTGYSPGTAMSVVAFLQSNSVLGYVILTWAGTVLLLRYNIKRVGRVKFWVLVTLPLVYFVSYNISLFPSLYPNSPVTAALSSNLVIPALILIYSTTLCGILFGLAFRSVAKFVLQSDQVRDYMIITGYGFILFFSAANASVLQAGYPPYGLIDVSFVGLSSFLILTGLSHSAISVAHDTNLRQSIRNSALRESKLLDSIGTAQMMQDIEKKTMTITTANAHLLTEQSGIEPSLTDTEIKQYLDAVIEEIKKHHVH